MWSKIKNNFNAKNRHYSYNYRKPIKRRSSNKRFMVISLIVLSIVIVLFTFIKPLPIVTADSNSFTITATSSNQVPWPNTGNSAIGAQYFGPLLSNKDESAVPIASTAKIFTALLLNHLKPLNGDGDNLIINSQDVQFMQDYVAKNGSVLPVNIDQTLTQKEALQALLIVSANNIADTLAVKAFGSIDAYVAYANTTLKDWGFKDTVIADASGYSPQTKSTATELVKAADMLISIPALADIVRTSQASSANIGVINNTNKVLGANGVIGVKTGNTEEAGGCFVVAQQFSLAEGQVVTMLVAVLGQYNVPDAVDQSLKLSQAASTGFAYKTIIPKDTVANNYSPSWGGSYNAVTSIDTKATIWQWEDTILPIQNKNITYKQPVNEPVGNIEVNLNNKSSNTPLVLKNPIQKPSLWWRFTNIF